MTYTGRLLQSHYETVVSISICIIDSLTTYSCSSWPFIMDWTITSPTYSTHQFGLSNTVDALGTLAFTQRLKLGSTDVGSAVKATSDNARLSKVSYSSRSQKWSNSSFPYVSSTESRHSWFNPTSHYYQPPTSSLQRDSFRHRNPYVP